MKKVIVALALLTVVALLLTGCTSGPKYNYPTGYAAYGGQGQPVQQNAYIGGGCAVEGVEPTTDLSLDDAASAA